MNRSEHIKRVRGMSAALGEETFSETATSTVETAVAGTRPLDSLPLAICYVPFQTWNGTYDGLTALESGTIFPELNLPFLGRGVK